MRDFFCGITFVKSGVTNLFDMKKRISLLFFLTFTCALFAQDKPSVQKTSSLKVAQSVSNSESHKTNQDTLKKTTTILGVEKKTAVEDTLKETSHKVKLYKTGAHASYYADMFNGRKTASGKKFSNNEYTAAHRKFAFGTKVKVTCLASGKSVIVTITDRGPFVKGREIDLSKRAFMQIAKHKGSGVMLVTIEEVIK